MATINDNKTAGRVDFNSDRFGAIIYHFNDLYSLGNPYPAVLARTSTMASLMMRHQW